MKTSIYAKNDNTAEAIPFNTLQEAENFIRSQIGQYGGAWKLEAKFSAPLPSIEELGWNDDMVGMWATFNHGGYAIILSHGNGKTLLIDGLLDKGPISLNDRQVLPCKHLAKVNLNTPTPAYLESPADYEKAPSGTVVSDTEGLLTADLVKVDDYGGMWEDLGDGITYRSDLLAGERRNVIHYPTKN